MSYLVDCQNISKSFNQGNKQVQVFRNLNLKIQAGKTLAILGPSGSGKSTLLSLMAGLDAPSSGEVLVFGKNLSRLSEQDLTLYRQKSLGIIFQQFNLFQHLTALENAALPLDLKGDEKAERIAMEALTKVGLQNRANHFPSELSGGEMQRVAIARAIVTSPALILADEPSGSLDQKTGDEVMKILFELVREKKTTMVLVTHNIELAQQCDEIFHFERIQS